MRKRDKTLLETVAFEWEHPSVIPSLHERNRDRVRQAMPEMAKALDTLEKERLGRVQVKVGQIWRALSPKGSRRLIQVVGIEGPFAVATTIRLVDGTVVPSHLQTSRKISLANMYPRGGYGLVEEGEVNVNGVEMPLAEMTDLLERTPHPLPDDETDGCHVCGGPDH